jgi:hypothetical protein
VSPGVSRSLADLQVAVNSLVSEMIPSPLLEPPGIIAAVERERQMSGSIL